MVSYEYDTWGKLLSVTGSAASTIGELNPFRYRGYYYDSETGLYYLNSRYYDPETGRFINSDGYTSKGQGVVGNNMFAYCNNNPVNMADPSGYHEGDYFGTPEAAAEDFARHYNADSINYDIEYGAVIVPLIKSYYKTEKRKFLGIFTYNKKVLVSTRVYGYTYTAVKPGGDIWVKHSKSALKKGVATVHTHAGYRTDCDSDYFSSDDFSSANKRQILDFVVTPKGEMYKYDPSLKMTDQNRYPIVTGLPSDPNHPDIKQRWD